MAFCSNCGHELVENAAFCGNCGAPVKQAEKPNTDNPYADAQYVSAAVSDSTKTSQNKVENTGNNDVQVSPKSRLAALLLGIFLGSLGIHNFYLGRIARGVVQCIMSVLGTLFMIIPIVQLAYLSIDYLMELGESGLELFLSDYLSDSIGFGVLLFFGLILLSIVSIWVFVEWIIIAAGGAKDKNKLPVKIWNP